MTSQDKLLEEKAEIIHALRKRIELLESLLRLSGNAMNRVLSAQMSISYGTKNTLKELVKEIEKLAE